MKIEINLKIIFAILLFFLIKNLNTYLFFLLFILIHELAHLIVGIIIGGKPKKMEISAFGVSLEFYSYDKVRSIYKIIFFVIGPLVNIIIGIAMLCLKTNNIIATDNIIIINFAIGIFNLIPILPLDGGKILKEFLKIILKEEKSNEIAIRISKMILILISLIYSVLIIKVKNIFILLLIIYLWYLYLKEEKKYYIYLKTKKAIKNVF